MTADDLETAKTEAVYQCAESWEFQDHASDIKIVGVAEGDVALVEWDDWDGVDYAAPVWNDHLSEKATMSERSTS